jgi:hypothetical protein
LSVAEHLLLKRDLHFEPFGGLLGPIFSDGVERRADSKTFVPQSDAAQIISRAHHLTKTLYPVVKPTLCRKLIGAIT